MKTKFVLIISIFAIAMSSCSNCDQTMDSKRLSMVERQIRFRGISDEKILRVMSEVPRDNFVLPDFRHIAYDDVEVPIGEGQTLDRPYEDALMLVALDLKEQDKVLEVGTGSGYLSALISKLASKVYTVEINEALGSRAKETLKDLGYNNVIVKIGDGYLGWPEEAPFQAIILTCSPTYVPEPLKDQLAEGGRLVLPLGGDKRFQELLLYTKKDGKFILEKRIAPTSFVPMKGIIKEK